MSFSPIAYTIPNYRDFKNYWLKAYDPGTTTPRVMALNGETQVVKVQLNADGFPASAGGALVIPYIEGAYDLWAFPTEEDADSNTTTNAERLADNITASISPDSLVISPYTLVEAKALTGAVIGQIIQITDRGNCQFEAVSSITNTPNELDVIQGQGAVAWQLTTDKDVNIVGVGCVGNGVNNDSPALERAIELALSIKQDVIAPVADSFYRLDDTVVISGGDTSQGIKINGGALYRFGGYFKFFSNVCFDIQSQINLQLQGIRVEGSLSGGVIDPNQDIFKLTGSANIVPVDCWFHRVGRVVDRTGIVDTYYTAFEGCRIDNVFTVYDSSVTYNLDFIRCRIFAFDKLVETASGAGPIAFIGGSIEQWTTAIVQQKQDNTGLPVAISGVYIENYPQLPAPAGFPNTVFSATSAIIGASSLAVTGSRIYLQGIRRFLTPNATIKTTVASNGNTFEYFVDEVTGLSDTEWVYPSTLVSGVFNDSIVPLAEEPTDGVRFLYEPTYFEGAEGSGYDPLKDKRIVKSIKWEDLTLINGYVAANAGTENPPAYAFHDDQIIIRGSLDATLANNEAFAQIGEVSADALYLWGNCITASTDLVSFRCLTANGEFRIENYSTLSSKDIKLDGMAIPASKLEV